MKNPRGKLLGLLAIFAAIGIITATGAFTTVSAERTAEVGVAGDASALLGLQPSDGSNGGYASLDSGTDGASTLQIDFSNVDGAGVNDEAQTDIQGVFVITNNGNQAVNVSISDEDLNAAGTAAEANPEDDAVTFYNATIAGLEHTNGGLEDSSHELGVGESLVVSIYIDTVSVDDTEENDLIDRITVEATASS